MEKSTVLTSVVIPNYNGIAYIDNCLQSLLQNKESKFKIIVVDNASTDGSLERIRDQYPEVVLLCSKENEGFSKAVNRGILAADTEFVLLLNNDTVVEPDFVYQLECAIASHKECFSVSSKMLCYNDPQIIDDAGDLYCALGWAFSPAKGKKANTCESEKKVFAACAGAAIYRRELLVKIGLFDEEHFAYLEDIDVGYRAKIEGYYHLFCPSAKVLHIGSASSGSTHNEFKVNLSSRNSIYLIYKNMPFLQIVINLPFLLPGFLVKYIFFHKKGLGNTYLLGIKKGFALCKSENGKAHKVKFRAKQLPNYIKIQLELWWNIIRRVTG